MAQITGQATGQANHKQVLLNEALQDALDKAPPPRAGSDIVQLKLAEVRIKHGGFVGSTTTTVTLDID